MKTLLSCWMMVCVLFPLAAFGEAEQPQRQITVMGEAVVNVEPDKVILTLGIETMQKKIDDAKEENSRITQKVQQICLKNGVQQGHIHTDHLYISPYYDSSYRKENLLGYTVKTTVEVTIMDVTSLETILTDLLQAGVNYVHGIDFQTTKFKEYRQQARELALKAAQEKAAQMTAVLGVTAGQPIDITEMDNASNWWYSGWWGYRRSQGMSQNVAQNVNSGDSGEPAETVALGKIGIRAKVKVTFALE